MSRKNVDILLGLLSWTIALSGIFWMEIFSSPPPNIVVAILIPSICLTSLIMMGLLRSRPYKQLFWALLSAPVAFAYWLIGLYVFFIWVFRGFAP